MLLDLNGDENNINSDGINPQRCMMQQAGLCEEKHAVADYQCEWDGQSNITDYDCACWCTNNTGDGGSYFIHEPDTGDCGNLGGSGDASCKQNCIDYCHDLNHNPGFTCGSSSGTGRTPGF